MDYVLRIGLDAAHNITSATLTAFEDETQRYSVAVGYSPFDDPVDVLKRVTSTLDKQLMLW